MMNSIDLYILTESPACRAVITAAKYLKLNVVLIHVNLHSGEQNQDWFVKLNPQHCLPTINDNGFILWESRAIMSYFANCYTPTDPVYPRDPQKRAIVDRLLQYDLNVFNRALCDFLIPVIKEKKKKSSVSPVIIKKVDDAFDFLETEALGNDNPYLAGDHFTLADISVYYSLWFAVEFRHDFSKYERISAWHQRMKLKIEEIEASVTFPYKRVNEVDVPISEFCIEDQFKRSQEFIAFKTTRQDNNGQTNNGQTNGN